MNHKQAILYGVGIWVFVFVVAMFAFPLRSNERPLFESIMPVALVLATTVMTVKYFKTVKQRFVYIGLCLGLIWLAVNLGIDALMFSWGPMQMSLIDYLKDIGVTYLLIPVIPVGCGYILKQRAEN